MKFKRTLSILTLPLICLLTSCDEEIIYGDKSIFERPENYSHLYWLGDAVDINNDTLIDLSSYNQEAKFNNYTRLFVEKQYVDQSGEYPLFEIASTDATIDSNNPFVYYEITKGHRYIDSAGYKDAYYITGIKILNLNYKPIFGVDYRSSKNNKKRKMAEYGFINNIDYAHDERVNNNFIDTKYNITISFEKNCFSLTSKQYDKNYWKITDDNFDESIYRDDSKRGITIYFLSNSWFDENFKN